MLWVREISEKDIRQVGDDGPTIDSITVAEFELRTVLKEWLAKVAPVFLR
jgi:hypothetical protein